MAISFLTTSSAQGTSNVAISTPSGVVVGDLLVAFISTSTNTTVAITPPDGWAKFTSDSLMAGFWRIAGGGDATSWSFGTDAGTATVFGTIVRVTGADVLNPIASSGTATSAAGVTLDLPSVTGVAGGGLLEMVGCSTGGSNSYTPPASSTSLYSTFASGSEQSGAYEILASSGATGTRSWTNSSTVMNKGMIAVIQPPQTTTGSATPTVVSQVGSSNTSGTSLTVTAPSGIQSGDLLVLHIDCNAASGTWTPPDSTWTQQAHTGTLGVFTKIATGSEPASWAFTRNGLGSGNKATAFCVRSHYGVDVAETINRGSSSSFAFASMSAAQANSLALYSVISFNGGNPWTTPAGVTEYSDTVDGVNAGETLASSGASTARTFTPSAAANASGAALIIRPGAGDSGASSSPGSIKITYKVSNTFTCPAGVTSVRVQCEGAGGPGGNGATVNRGGGGGGGAYAEEPALTVVPGTSYTVSVAPTASTVGTAGSASSFLDGATVLVKAAGGGAGGNASGLSNGSAGAAGLASNSTGSITTNGTAGTAGGAGGAGAPPLGGAGGTTGPGTVPGGGGGGGAALSGAGQAGAQGVVIVTFEYVSDSVLPTESIQLVVDWNRTINESVAAIDSIAKMILKPSSAETVAVSDGFSKTISQDNPETIATTDQVVQAINQLKNETILTTDSVSKILSVPEIEAVTASDTEFALFIKHANPENVVTSDTISSVLNMAVDESVVLSESALVTLVFLRYIDDLATASDQLSLFLGMAKSDAVSILEDTFKIVFKRVDADAVSTSDSVFVQSIFTRDVSDTLTTVDSWYKTLHLGVDDSISGSAAPVTGTRKLFVTLSD